MGDNINALPTMKNLVCHKCGKRKCASEICKKCRHSLLPKRTFNTDDLPGELWENIHGYEGVYMVSNMGRVKSLARYRKAKRNGLAPVKEKILAPILTMKGYHQVTMPSPDRPKRVIFIHRLVAEAFIPNPENKPEPNHINSIRSDNRVENLEWTTKSENKRHSVMAGISKPPTTSIKIKAKIDNCETTFESIIDAARKLKISPNTVRDSLWKRTEKNKIEFQYC